MNTQTRSLFVGFICGVLILFMAAPVGAYERFDSCAGCHSSLNNTGDGNSVHDAHAAPANACSDCHATSTNNPPLSDCVKCHGRAEDAGGDSGSAGIGRGLRLHHQTTGAASCGGCHTDAQGASAFGEQFLPSFYAEAYGGAGLDSCDGSEELYASASFSLDNDGDGLTDGNDPDCATSVPPTANANGPYSAVAGTAITFSSEGSSDSDGTIVSFAWDFGDGSTGTGASPTHTYLSEGTVTVTLTVTDNDGLTGTGSTTATIVAAGGNLPPVARANGPYTGYVGESLAFDGTASTDTDGAVVRFDWDFGDGTIAEDAGPEPTHVYGAVGEYTVTLTVFDDAGDSGSSSSTASISERGTPSDGETQYSNYCASCHGDPWADPVIDPTMAGAHRVAGARSCSVEASIFGTTVFPDGAPGMQFLQALISDGTIDAGLIADYLNSQSISGEQRYVTACAGCHGDDGSGGRTGESVRGESAHETREAIREERSMRFLACLPDSDIDAIAAFLGGSDNEVDTGHSGEHDSDDDEDSGDSGGGSGDWSWLLLLVTLSIRRLARQRDVREGVPG